MGVRGGCGMGDDLMLMVLSVIGYQVYPRSSV